MNGIRCVILGRYISWFGSVEWCMVEWLWIINSEWYGRKWSWPVSRYCSCLCRRNWGKYEIPR